MKKKTFILSITLSIVLILLVVLFIKLRKKSVPEESQEIISSGSYDILVYNCDPSFSETFNKISDEYSNSSGIIVAFSDKNIDLLCDFGNNAPDIFMVKNFSEFRSQQQYGNIFDFSNASEKTFREVMDNIPDLLRLKSHEINNCGVPLTLRGFGLAVNQSVLASIFGEETYKNVINDLMVCSYDDFKNFVEGINYSSVSINGHEYSLNRVEVNKLESIFAYHIETSFEHLLNNALCESFSSHVDLAVAKESSNISGKISKWMQMVELLSSHSNPSRGSSFVNAEINSRKNAIENFANGKSLFLISEDIDYEEIKKYNIEASRNLIFIPLKAPFESNASNSKITVYCPYYLVINNKSPKMKIVQDFLTWLISSPVSQKLLVEGLGFIPYNFEPGNIENSLGRSSLTYFQSGNVLNPVFQGANKNWINDISQYFRKIYLPLKSWNEKYYTAFENYCMKRWVNG